MKKEQVTIGARYIAKVSGKLAEVRIDSENAHGGWNATNVGTRKKVRIKSAQRLRAPAGIVQPLAPASADAAAANARTGKAAKDDKPTKVSGLDIAAAILKEAGQPMHVSQVLKIMMDKSMWKTGGKTPQATIYAAIIREIKAKGDQARFKKINKGVFALNA